MGELPSAAPRPGDQPALGGTTPASAVPLRGAPELEAGACPTTPAAVLVPASGDVDSAARAGILGVADVAAGVVAAPVAVVPATVLGAVGAAGAATVVVIVRGGELALVLIAGTETVVLTTGGDTGVLTVGAGTVVLPTEVDTVVLIVGDGTGLADGKVGRTVTVGRPTVEATAGTCATKYPAIATAPSATTAQRFIWPS